MADQLDDLITLIAGMLHPIPGTFHITDPDATFHVELHTRADDAPAGYAAGGFAVAGAVAAVTDDDGPLGLIQWHEVDVEQFADILGQMCVADPAETARQFVRHRMGLPFHSGGLIHAPDDQPDPAAHAWEYGEDPHQIAAEQARQPGPLHTLPGETPLWMAAGPGPEYWAWLHVALGVWIAHPGAICADVPQDDPAAAQQVTAAQVRALLAAR